MDMKIDPLKIRRLREARGWSQEHLAEVAGLSARTVQRIEADGNASAESRMALAAALSVAAAELGTDEPADSRPSPSPAAVEQRRRNGWQRHLLIYVVICTGLVMLDASGNGAITWSKWPVLGWGIGLLMHWLRRSPA